jgi:hypothetical protein
LWIHDFFDGLDIVFVLFTKCDVIFVNFYLMSLCVDEKILEEELIVCERFWAAVEYAFV